MEKIIMKKNDTLTRIPLANATFVSGEGSLCYEDVIDDFPNAKYIDIITFNISQSQNSLLEALKEAGKRNIPIRLVTNIPNRWHSYWGATARNRAKETIKIYQRKLKPESIGKLANIFFKFNNHGKIILTNNIVYWGSANFSDESVRNYECGTLSKDRHFIDYIHNSLIPCILSNSIDYYKRNYINYVAGIYSAISFIHNMFEEVHDSSYGIYEDYDTNFRPVEYFNYSSNGLTWKLLENLMETVQKFEELLSGIISELDDEYDEFIDDSDFEHYEEADKLIEKFRHDIDNLNNQISSICYSLEDLAKFDEETYTFRILSEDYGNVAYDDALDYYVELSSNEAREAYEDLIEFAKPNIDNLLLALSNYEDVLLKYADELIDLSQENEDIDNT